MNANKTIGNVMIIFCIVAFIGLVGCSDMSDDMLADDTEAAANFADAPAVVEVKHGTILGPPLVVPDDAPTVDIEAVFSKQPEAVFSRQPTEAGRAIGWNLEGIMLRFRITVSDAPKDDMVVLVSGTCEFQSEFLDPYGVRTFNVYMIIPKGQTTSNIYRTSFAYPKELNIAVKDPSYLYFEVIPFRAPLPALPLNAFLDDFIPPVQVPEHYKFQLYKVAENARVKTFRNFGVSDSGLGVRDLYLLLTYDSNFIIAPELLNSHLDP